MGILRKRKSPQPSPPGKSNLRKYPRARRGGPKFHHTWASYAYARLVAGTGISLDSADNPIGLRSLVMNSVTVDRQLDKMVKVRAILLMHLLPTL